MGDARWYLVCYDVRDPKRLRRTAQHMEGYGERVQYSVFRCWLNKRQMERLRWELTQLLLPKDDVVFIPLCPRCVASIKVTHERVKRSDWSSEPRKHKVI